MSSREGGEVGFIFAAGRSVSDLNLRYRAPQYANDKPIGTLSVHIDPPPRPLILSAPHLSS